MKHCPKWSWLRDQEITLMSQENKFKWLIYSQRNLSLQENLFPTWKIMHLGTVSAGEDLLRPWLSNWCLCSSSTVCSSQVLSLACWQSLESELYNGSPQVFCEVIQTLAKDYFLLHEAVFEPGEEILLNFQSEILARKPGLCYMHQPGINGVLLVTKLDLMNAATQHWPPQVKSPCCPLSS